MTVRMRSQNKSHHVTDATTMKIADSSGFPPVKCFAKARSNLPSSTLAARSASASMRRGDCWFCGMILCVSDIYLFIFCI